MGGRGVHFAIDAVMVARLLEAEEDEDTALIVEEIEESWDRPFLFETDKAWDALHRCLSDGTLELSGGSYPLSHVVLGGAQVYEGEEYVVALVRVEQVPEVAAAMARIDKEWLRQRYDTMEFPGYQGVRGDEDFAYTWANFRGLDGFFEAAARAGHAVIFTVDQ
ncbi:YfbM family protein [Streptomyces sp. NPDC089795]|uniref:YfbM family protein n=1 Tax=Streptomyces sp. NPDC089795 TaxID=3155297 RepID=UPI00343F93FD